MRVCRHNAEGSDGLLHDKTRPPGTTAVFATMSVLDGKVVGRCVRRDRQQEVIRFIATVKRSAPAAR